MTFLLRSAALVCILIGACSAPKDSRPERPPNGVFILTDNQGAWTLGC